ncbi:DUF4352 domain-containing protein [Mycolicibacter virginiensis]|uniref:DUF4352 domain-containing protein n=1 Tax=Mycolicibacter virginiensis TaxID=1795032 RepID=UPI001F0423EC|nr:DUF4352 domain-containing protein [Mycolicibacter virginiensis]ULP45947.1 DUF4352 domain-containing protein [Mycolicibacter virginiensis]
MNRPIVALSVFALTVAMSAACSSHTDSTSAPPAADTSNGASPATPKPAGHTGDTLNLTRADGSTVTVTLDKVINPATVTPGASDPGITYIATQFTIANPGTAAMNGDINTNVWAFGSDGQRYAPNLKDVGECTNFDAGMFHIAPGESATGCVVFALPAGVSPAKVRYAPSSGFADGFGEWLFPSPSRATPPPSVN